MASVGGFTCEEPNRVGEELCKPETMKHLIPGYNYTTSNDIGLKLIPQPNTYFEPKPLFSGKEKQVRDVRSASRHYTTSYNQSYHAQQPEFDPINMANRFRGTNNLYIKEFEEKLKKSGVGKMSDPISEYKKQYQQHKLTQDIAGRLHDVTPSVECKIKAVAKKAQPLLDISSLSIIRLLDNYVTQIKFDYTHISPERRDFYQTPKEIFVNKPEKNASRIYEESLFKSKFLDRTVPKHVFPVPHSGMQSEMQREYRDIWGERYKTPKPLYEKIEVMRQSPKEVMIIPGMYKPESTRYGLHTAS